MTKGKENERTGWGWGGSVSGERKHGDKNQRRGRNKIWSRSTCQRNKKVHKEKSNSPEKAKQKYAICSGGLLQPALS